MFDALDPVFLKEENENQIKYGIMPSSQRGHEFDNAAIKAKSSLNREFMYKPMNNSAAIVWYHQGVLSHVCISIEDKLYGFAYFLRTAEAKSLKNSIKSRLNGIKGIWSSITVQWLKISPMQKRKIEHIFENNMFPCGSCMHSVSRILEKITGIQIPSLINQLPDTSLIYLKNLQQRGEKTLSEQKTYGSNGIVWNNKVVTDKVNRVVEALLIGYVPYYISSMFNFSEPINLCIGAATSLAVLYKIHQLVRSEAVKK